MLKKLTEEQQIRILETAIAEFGVKGFEGTSVNVIARKAGVSVGVIYKYYASKEELFTVCIDRSMSFLEEAYKEIAKEGGSLRDMVRRLIRVVQSFSEGHPDYIRMYHQITTGNDSQQAARMAKIIESRSGRVYREMIEQARKAGQVREDLSPEMFAFFFDNLLMMLQFSYSCFYYQERMKVYCGEGIAEQNEEMENQLIRFLESGFLYCEEK